MNVLWLKVGGLWPPHTGGRLRSLHILEQVARHHRVELLTTHSESDDHAGLAERLEGRAELASFPWRAPKHGGAAFAHALVRSWGTPLPVDLWRWRVPELRRAAARRLAAGTVDVCVADFLAAMPNLPFELRGVPLVHFSHNVEHSIWRRLAAVETRPWRRLALEIEWRKMRRFEALSTSRASLTLAVSDADRDCLAALAPRAQITAIPTGVDPSYFRPGGGAETPGSLVYSGSMDWYPNEDAVLHFVTSILPRVQREVPGTTLTVVGRDPSPRLRAAAAGAGVRLTGRVDDVRPHVARAAVFVVPLRVGGGTRLKIFEALAMGKAVVSTSVGAEGLPLVPGEHFVCCDEPADFAHSVAALLNDPRRRSRLGRAGRRLVEERFSWAQVGRRFASNLEEVSWSRCA